MNVWLINPYGPLPSEGWREYRFATLGRYLARAGHTVTWWTSGFSHHFKRHRSTTWRDIEIESGFTIRLVPSPAYSCNIGIGRIWRDGAFALRTYHRARAFPHPDVIVSSESPLTFGFAGARLARRLGCRIIHDQMDLWPELIEKAFPTKAQRLAHALLFPSYRYRRRFYGEIDGLVALAQPYLDIPMIINPILEKRPHAVVYNGIDVSNFRACEKVPITVASLLPTKASGEIWVIFAGSLGPSYDIDSILRAAALAHEQKSLLRFIVAGDGPDRVKVADYARRNAGVNFNYLGHLSAKELSNIYPLCDVGLAAYSTRSNVEMPDKFYDYTAAGLPIVNSLRGEVSSVIRQHCLGIQYTAGVGESLFRAIMSLVQDEALRIKMANNSYAIANLYDQHRQYGVYIKIIEDVCFQREN